MLWVSIDGAIGEHRAKCLTNCGAANQPRTAWMHTDNVILIGPAGHEFFKITRLQRLIELCFDDVCCTTHCGSLKFGFRHAEIVYGFGP